MSIIDTLGSRRRITTALANLLREDELRALAEEHHLSIPGFRAGRGPVPLLARSAAAACQSNRRLKDALDARLERVAATRRGARTEASAVDRLARVEDLGAADARALLASALSDARAEVVAAAVGLVDALEAGSRRLPSPRAAHVGGGPSAALDAPARPPHPAGTDPSAPVAGTALDELRREATRQESVRTRLRRRLDEERAAHAETRRELKRLKGAGRQDPALDRALAEARARGRRRDSELAEQHAALEHARTDVAILAEGARALEALLPDAGIASADPIRPTKPKRVSDVPPELKGRTPASVFWPAHTDAFLRRLASDPFVDAVHLIGVSSGRAMRILADPAIGVFIAQLSDGKRAAQLLIRTTADTRASHTWMRRHLATEYFGAR